MLVAIGTCVASRAMGAHHPARARRRGAYASAQAPRKTPGTSDEYNEMMKKAMANPYEYRHEDGIYYTVMNPSLIVGGQPQSAADVEMLAREEGVTHVINLQQDKDIKYWGIDYSEISDAAARERVAIVRRPAVDFDPNSLRSMLPTAVASIDAAVSSGGRAYVHCTAGLGRAPGVSIAYLYWCQNMTLDEAYEYLTSRRPCGPKREAIRGATHDLLRVEGAASALAHANFEEAPADAFAELSETDRALILRRLRASPEAAEVLVASADIEAARADAYQAFAAADSTPSRQDDSGRLGSLLGRLFGDKRDV
mmetsp:Transcript_14449/g.60282  ORF Transcript_14449/g.60282 Transcript_14449/m.60282 type:complete len:311 (-) Transcript_14449:60-992(-)|eukprot:PRCOL_00000216-RA